MALAHLAVLTAAVVVPLWMPCVVAVAIYLDEPAVRRAWRRRGRQELCDLRVLDRTLTVADPVPGPSGLDPPSLEQIAGDLRRLDRQRRTRPTRDSPVWLSAVLRAYDERLCLACACLGVPETLRELDGLDREMERIRVEEALRAAGLVLR